MKPYCAFISYTREDYDSAFRIYKALAECQIKCWLDKKCMKPGVNWRAAIRQAMKDSRYFLAVLSTSSVTDRGYMLGEIADALGILKEYAEDQPYLIPVRLNAVIPKSHAVLQDLNWLDMFPDWDQGIERLAEVLKEGCK